jgi:hypothetical protein
MGYEDVSLVCLGFALVIGALFILLFLSELLWLGVQKMVRRFLPEIRKR